MMKKEENKWDKWHNERLQEKKQNYQSQQKKKIT